MYSFNIDSKSQITFFFWGGLGVVGDGGGG